MLEATVCHLLRESGEKRELLLGKRVTLFCKGIWNGPGGKLRKNEKPLACLRREVREEIGIFVDTKNALHVGTVDFYHPYKSAHRLEWRVYYFNVTAWQGEPEHHPRIFDELAWFKIDRLPYESMLPDRKIWLPLVLGDEIRSRLFTAEIYYVDAEMRSVERGSFQFITR